MNKTKTKCDFCRYWSGRSCMTKSNSVYCKEALDEYYQFINSQQPPRPIKSLRSWDRK